MMSTLIFVDTNIYLDFYRVSGTDATLSILKHFDENHDRIITTSEVEMEYKKNRQRVIIKSLSNLKPRDSSNLIVPTFLKESKRNKSILKTQKCLSDQIRKLKDRTAKLLESPERNDPVYMALQRLFKAKGDCHLTRTEKVRFQIRELAQKRFVLGYPPRKPSDTSMVDAINWEWIVYCAQHCSDDIVIVSRDSDYGVHHEGMSILNDWLLLEFKERVSRKRSVLFTNRLTVAFKQASISVSTEEERAEQELFESKSIFRDVLDSIDTSTLNSETLARLRQDRNEIILNLGEIDKKLLPLEISKIFAENLDLLKSSKSDNTEQSS